MKVYNYLLILVLFFNINLIANGVYNFNNWKNCELTHCDIVSIPGKIKILHIHEDEFNDNTLSSYWIFENDMDNCGGVYMFYNPGYARIVSCVNSDWICSNKNITSIYQQVEGEFGVEVGIDGNPMYPHRWQFSGAFIRNLENPNEYIRIGFATDEYHVKIDTQSCPGIAETACVAQGIFGFKITKEGSMVKTWYKKGSYSPWIHHKTFSNINWRFVVAGIVSFDPNVQYSYADFDYFHYQGQKVFNEASLITPAIDLGAIPIGQGIIKWAQTLPDPGTHIKLYIQTSDDGIIWNEPWTGPYLDTQYNGTPILSENKRYIRIKAVLTTENIDFSPVLGTITIDYPAIPPAAPCISAVNYTENTWTNLKEINLKWECADSNGVTIVGYYYTIDEELNTETANFTTKKELNIKNLSEGKHVFRLCAQADWQNNYLLSKIEEYHINIDRTPPKKPIKIYSSHEEYKESSNNNFEIKLILEDSLVNTSNVSGINGISYIFTEDNINKVDNTVDNKTGDIKIRGIDNGTWFLKVKTIDKAGNMSDEFIYCIKIKYTGNIISFSKVKLYPNPVRENFNIEYELAGNAKNVIIKIIDSGGRLIKKISGDYEAGINNLSENIKGFSNGVYFVKIEVERNDGRKEKIIKKMVVKK